MSELTKTQIGALWGVYLKGDPYHDTEGGRYKSRMGGARSRMVNLLIYDGYLTERRKLTSKGYAVLLALTPHDERLTSLHAATLTEEAERATTEKAAEAAARADIRAQVAEETKSRRAIMALCSFDVSTWTDEALTSFAAKLYLGKPL